MNTIQFRPSVDAHLKAMSTAKTGFQGMFGKASCFRSLTNFLSHKRENADGLCRVRVRDHGLRSRLHCNFE